VSDTNNRVAALGTARYLGEILSSVIGKPMMSSILVGQTMKEAMELKRHLTLTLTLEDAQKLADALNRDPEKTS
jgi:hypothetical protein